MCNSIEHTHIYITFKLKMKTHGKIEIKLIFVYIERTQNQYTQTRYIILSIIINIICIITSVANRMEIFHMYVTNILEIQIQ